MTGCGSCALASRSRRSARTFDTEEIIHRVAIGEYDLTVADSNLLEACLEYRDDVRPALDLTRDRPIAMAVPPGSPELLENLNRFLTEAQLTDRAEDHHTGDLAEIKQRRVLRMITRNTASTYFLWRGELVGFEYDLMREFARQQGLRLEIVVPPNLEDLLPWLGEGRGDVHRGGADTDGRTTGPGCVVFQTVQLRIAGARRAQRRGRVGWTARPRRASGRRATQQ